MNDTLNSCTPKKDAATGRFVSGGGGTGRRKGSRNKLSLAAVCEAFCADFVKHGPATIRRLREENPGKYLALMVQMMPKDLHIAMEVKHSLFADAPDFLTAFRMARDMIGAEPPMLIEDGRRS
jgi:hypothetical protein